VNKKLSSSLFRRVIGSKVVTTVEPFDGEYWMAEVRTPRACAVTNCAPAGGVWHGHFNDPRAPCSLMQSKLFCFADCCDGQRLCLLLSISHIKYILYDIVG